MLQVIHDVADLFTTPGPSAARLWGFVLLFALATFARWATA